MDGLLLWHPIPAPSTIEAVTNAMVSDKVLWKQKGFKGMTVTLNLPPDIEASLIAQAQAEGLSVDQFLSRELQTLVVRGSTGGAEPADAEAWEHRLDEWLDSFSETGNLSEDALKRENWYADRR